MNDDRLQELYVEVLESRQTGDRTECVNPDELLELVERRGTEDDRLRTLDHVMSCPVCSKEFELLRSVGVARDTLEAEKVSVSIPAVSTRRWRPRLAIAATLAGVIGAGLVWTRFGDGGEEPVRGGGSRVVLVAPVDVVPVGESVTFIWHSVPGASGYVVELLGNDGALIRTWTTSDTVMVTGGAIGLEPDGQYQWWVRTRSPSGTERRSSMQPIRAR